MGLPNDHTSLDWQQHIQQDCSVLVDQWFLSLETVQISYLPAHIVKPRLQAFSEIFFSKLFGQLWDLEGIEEIGYSLAQAGYDKPEILEVTGAVWLAHLEQHDALVQQPSLLRRLFLLVNALSVGFCHYQKIEIQPVAAYSVSGGYEQLFRSNLPLLKTFNALPVGLCFADYAGHITLTNRAFQDMFGYSEAELYGTPLSWYAYPDDQALTTGLFEKLRLQGQANYQVEKRYYRRNGSLFWVRLNMSQLSDIEGWGPFILGIFEDITSQKEKESTFEELKRTIASLRERERVSLARELHDGPVQELLAVNYQIQALLKHSTEQCKHKRSLQEHSLEIEKELEQISNYVLDSVSQLRGFISELRPAGLLELGLPAAIEGFVHYLEQKYSSELPTIVLELDERAARLADTVAINLFRVLQEAVRNAIYHAQASHITIKLVMEPLGIMLVIIDDGKGFELPSDMNDLIHTNHFGLAGMVERIHTINGRYQIESQPSQGTIIRVWVDLEGKRPADLLPEHKEI